MKIQTKAQLKEWIKADFDAQGMTNPFWARLTYGENWSLFQYMKILRNLEYYSNNQDCSANKLFYYWYLLKHRRNCITQDLHISPNIVGKGLKIVHPGFRRIDKVVKSIGENCTILPMVLFGKKRPEIDYGCIEVGNNCYFGTGCTILGPVKIGNNVIVGAGAVVTKDIPDNCTVAGVPAKIIRQ